MKKILFFSVLALLTAACHKEPSPQDSDNEYLVYTSPGKGVTFTSFRTFDLADSLLVIGQSDKPEYSQSNNALALIQQVRVNMENLGYIYTPDNPDADLGIQMTFVIKTERYVKYYNDPYWWLDYPGYWPSGYWGNWTGFYYPYPVSYTYTTNALITDMVDLTGDQRDGSEPLEVVWTSYIGGPAGYSVQNDVNRLKAAVDQAFVQSPYMNRNSSRR
jgi:hypothetical protein